MEPDVILSDAKNLSNPDGSTTDPPRATRLFKITLAFGRAWKIVNPFREEKEKSGYRKV